MTESLKPKSSRGWRLARGVVIALAVLATLIAAFYTEEDWRGKRAWDNCKRELEAQGVQLDWSKFMPPTVPDDQNFYTASTNILQKFKQLSGTNDPDYNAVQANPWLRLQVTSSNIYPTLGAQTVANIIVTPKAPLYVSQDTNTLVLNPDDPNAAERARNLIRAVIGPSMPGGGLQFYLFDLRDIPRAQIYVLTPVSLPISALQQMIPSDTRLERATARNAASLNSFDVQLFNRTSIVLAADYLKWSDQFVPAFNDIREALKRPYAIIPGDYSNPAFMPIPNFLIMRSLAQTLAQRAQCYLLLGEPDKALHELTLVHNVCRILEKPPTGQPETLIEAMINVHITGLYVSAIAQGLQRGAWQESQLDALQKQLKETDLCSFVFEALREGPAHISRVAEFSNTPYWGWSKLFRWSVPRGWIYQMMVVTVEFEDEILTGVDLEKNTISPTTLDKSMHHLETALSHHSPFNLLADIAIPNSVKAWQSTAYNQTLVNEAQIACALERYRLAHGEYPETLDALLPQFIENIPHDIIGGARLHYRRTADGKFLLYSIGWNEIDDGGQEPPRDPIDFTKGDWVWGN